MEKLKSCPFCGSEANTTFNTILVVNVFSRNVKKMGSGCVMVMRDYLLIRAIVAELRFS